MSWIRDVKNELSALDVSYKSVRKFGIVVGVVFLTAGLLLIWKNHWPVTRIVFACLGSFLILGGAAASKSKEFILVYKVWMAFAFALGWIVSRFILIILFYFVLMPVGLVAKLFKKEFLDLKFKDGKKSYWISKEKSKTDYERMY